MPIIGFGRGTVAIFLLVLLFLTLACPLWAQTQQPQPDLTEISLESLLDVQVTIASRQAEKIVDTAAAVYVVTQDDIQRFGFTSVAEALRMVPGLDVGRVSGGIWAISARGFNARYADKLLVLVDGRTVYSHTFSGVVWDVQDVPIEDIDRIEVIRGAGGALWGANAVNGVINIITKSAKATKGGLLVAGSGSEELGFSTLRWGGDLGKSGGYRFSEKFFDRAPLLDITTGQPGVDSTRLGSTSFRADWGSGRDSYTASGDLYRSYLASSELSVTPTAAPDTYFKNTANNFGGNVLGRWTRDYSKTSALSLQFYVEEADRKDLRGNEHSVITDLDFQHSFSAGSRNKIVWGMEYRQISDGFETGLKLSIVPNRQRSSLLSVFSQDDLSLPGHVRLTFGAKVEEYSIDGDNFEPSARALWTPLAKHSLWLSASRAVNRVSRIQTNSQILTVPIPIGGGINALLIVNGNPAVQPPTVKDFEAGYRYKPGKKFYVDLATFYNVYQLLYTNEPGPPIFNASEPSEPAPFVEFPLTFANGMNGQTYGGETSASFIAATRWKVNVSYSFLRMQLHLAPSSHDTVSEAAEGQNPRNQFQIRNSYDLTSHLHLASSLYFTERLPAFGIKSYARLDLNLGWRFSEKASVSAAIQNALQASHEEFVDTTGSQSSLVRRSAYVKMQWHF